MWKHLAIFPISDKGVTTTEPEGDILTLDEVVAYLKAGERTDYRLAAEGRLPRPNWAARRASEAVTWMSGLPLS